MWPGIPLGLQVAAYIVIAYLLGIGTGINIGKWIMAKRANRWIEETLAIIRNGEEE